MAYTPTNWQTGDVITAAKLNNIENALANGLFVVRITSLPDENNTPVASTTSGQIIQAFQAGQIPVLVLNDTTNYEYSIFLLNKISSNNDIRFWNSYGFLWVDESGNVTEDLPFHTAV